MFAYPGFEDTLATMEESLIKNEVRNIKRATLRGYDTGPLLKEDEDLNDREEVVQE